MRKITTLGCPDYNTEPWVIKTAFVDSCSSVLHAFQALFSASNPLPATASSQCTSVKLIHPSLRDWLGSICKTVWNVTDSVMRQDNDIVRTDGIRNRGM